jgi:hypothetical protein
MRGTARITPPSNHASRSVAPSPAGSRIADSISLDVIAQFFPLEEAREVLAETQRASVRERDLPAHVLV